MKYIVKQKFLNVCERVGISSSCIASYSASFICIRNNSTIPDYSNNFAELVKKITL